VLFIKSLKDRPENPSKEDQNASIIPADDRSPFIVFQALSKCLKTRSMHRVTANVTDYIEIECNPLISAPQAGQNRCANFRL
jgi:hypothetical protein